jgi:hypothetical protein
VTWVLSVEVIVLAVWLVRLAVEVRRYRTPPPPAPLVAPRSHVTLRPARPFDQDS